MTLQDNRINTVSSTRIKIWNDSRKKMIITLHNLIWDLIPEVIYKSFYTSIDISVENKLKSYDFTR